MVKRKQEAVSPEQLTVINDQEAALYEVGQWAGKPHYKCLLCKFDTLEEDVILIHIQTHFGGSQTKPSVLAADKRGNDVMDQVTSDGDLNGMFEVELKEVDSAIDEQGNEHKTYTIEE